MGVSLSAPLGLVPLGLAGLSHLALLYLSVWESVDSGDSFPYLPFA